jgi:hypothetical protein
VRHYTAEGKKRWRPPHWTATRPPQLINPIMRDAIETWLTAHPDVREDVRKLQADYQPRGERPWLSGQVT